MNLSHVATQPPPISTLPKVLLFIAMGISQMDTLHATDADKIDIVQEKKAQETIDAPC